jgi:hypothetical protein
VVAAGLTTSLPPDNGGDTNNFDLLDRPVPAGGAEPVSPWAWVTPDLFAALDVPLLDGRALREADSSTAAPVVLVSRAWARRYYPGERVVGKRLYAGGVPRVPTDDGRRRVGDVKYAGLAASADGVYAPTLGTGNRSLGLIVRTRVPPGALAGAVRAAVRAVDPGVPVRELAPMTVRLERGWPTRRGSPGSSARSRSRRSRSPRSACSASCRTPSRNSGASSVCGWRSALPRGGDRPGAAPGHRTRGRGAGGSDCA